MAYAVRLEHASGRQLAAVSATTTHQQLGADIRRLLDMVWPVLREQSVRAGCNVVVYHNGEHGMFTIDAGVETPDGFTPNDVVRRTTTPEGEVATTAHYGEYTGLALAYAALETWCSDNKRQQAAVSWEIYGDWDEDPARVRTDVYFLLEATGGAPSLSS